MKKNQQKDASGLTLHMARDTKSTLKWRKNEKRKA